MFSVETKETKMRVISQNELSFLTRAQLFALLVQLRATLADLPAGAQDHAFCTATLINIRAALARKTPSP